MLSKDDYDSVRVEDLIAICLSSWYRSGSDQKLQSVLKPGGGRDFPTTSMLTINPGKDDDGAQYRCVIWNRALTDSEKMEAIVTLSVNCKDPVVVLLEILVF